MHATASYSAQDSDATTNVFVGTSVETCKKVGEPMSSPPDPPSWGLCDLPPQTYDIRILVSAPGDSFRFDDRPWSTAGECVSGPCASNTFEPPELPLPSPLVKLETVANGCGPGTAGTAPRYFDTTTYSDPGTKKSYTVTFRRACDMHDAAYNGAQVRDPFNRGQIVDFFRWGQKAIDDRFLRDMRLLCNNQIPADAAVARRQCKNKGARLSTGALTRYNAVRLVGHRSFVKRPKLSGTWIARDLRGKPRPAWQMRQTTRLVNASWKKPGNEGSFRGIIISQDGRSLISGYTTSKVKGVSTTRPTRFVFDPDQPQRVRLAGMLGGLVLTR